MSPDNIQEQSLEQSEYDALLEQADVCCRNNDLPQVILLLEKAFELDKRRPEACRYLWYYKTLQNKEEAVEKEAKVYLLEGLKHNPDNVQLLYSLSLHYYRIAQFERDKGQDELKEKSAQEILKLMDKLVPLNQNNEIPNFEVLIRYLQAYGMLSDKEQVEYYLKQIIRIPNPKYAELSALYRFAAQFKDLKLKCYCILRMFKLYRNDESVFKPFEKIQAFRQLSKDLYWLKRYYQAYRFMGYFQAAYPDNFDMWVFAATCLGLMGETDKEKVCRFYERGLKEQPKDYDLYFHYGRYLYAENINYELALKYLNLYIKQMPADIRGYKHLAKLYKNKLNNSEKALEIAIKGLLVEPNNPFLSELLESHQDQPKGEF